MTMMAVTYAFLLHCWWQRVGRGDEFRALCTRRSGLAFASMQPSAAAVNADALVAPERYR